MARIMTPGCSMSGNEPHGEAASPSSRIAMLARLRNAVSSDIAAADAAANDRNNPDAAFAQTTLDTACQNDEAITRLMLGQKPTSLADALSLLIAITEATDLLMDLACEAPAENKLHDLTKLVERAAANIALFCFTPGPALTVQEQRALRSLSRRFDLQPGTAGGEA